MVDWQEEGEGRDGILNTPRTEIQFNRVFSGGNITGEFD